MCKKISFLAGAVSYLEAYFGQGTGPVHIESVGCSGTESILLQCTHAASHNCYHAEDAGIKCSPPGS